MFGAYFIFVAISGAMSLLCAAWCQRGFFVAKSGPGYGQGIVTARSPKNTAVPVGAQTCGGDTDHSQRMMHKSSPASNEASLPSYRRGVLLSRYIIPHAPHAHTLGPAPVSGPVVP